MLLLCYGQPKSASTYLYHLISRASTILSKDQAELRKEVFGEDPSRMKAFWSGGVEEILPFLQNVKNSDYLALKTHAAYRPALKEYFAVKSILPFVSYRNIGDAALSAYEAGEKARKNKNYNQDFYKLETHRSAIDYIGKHTKTVTVRWLKSTRKYGFSYSYDELTANPEKILHDFAGKIGVDPDIFLDDPVISEIISGKKKAYNFNKGVAGRHRQVFSAEDLAYLDENYGTFNRFCENKVPLGDL